MNKHFYISIIIVIIFCGSKIFSQNSLYIGGRAADITCDTITGQMNEGKRDSVINFLQGKIIDVDVMVLYPISNDAQLKQISKNIIIHPLLVINDIIIRNVTMVNCFRNHFDRAEIKKIKHISKEKAEKMGILNVPKDGVLFITTKKNYYFDFSCE
jgi:hypothetical protein